MLEINTLDGWESKTAFMVPAQKSHSCGSRCTTWITSSPIHQPGSFSKPARSSLWRGRERDEGHGSTGEGEEDGLEECVPPFIPALTFVVARYQSHHQPATLHSQLSHIGWIKDSSHQHPEHTSSPIPQQHWMQRVWFLRRSNREALPDVYGWYCLTCLCQRAPQRVRLNWCLISVHSRGVLTALQVQRRQPEAMKGTYSWDPIVVTHSHTQTQTGSLLEADTQLEYLWVKLVYQSSGVTVECFQRFGQRAVG